MNADSDACILGGTARISSMFSSFSVGSYLWISALSESSSEESFSLCRSAKTIYSFRKLISDSKSFVVLMTFVRVDLNSLH